jgi:hypothetical protein
MTAPVSQSTEQVLRAAMQRLLSGSAVRTDGHLTIVNLAIEAGVSRATANRATAVLMEFRSAAAGRRAREVRVETALAGPEEESRNAHILAQHIQARALHKRQEDQRAARADVLPFRRKNHDANSKKGGETP